MLKTLNVKYLCQRLSVLKFYAIIYTTSSMFVQVECIHFITAFLCFLLSNILVLQILPAYLQAPSIKVVRYFTPNQHSSCASCSYLNSFLSYIMRLIHLNFSLNALAHYHSCTFNEVCFLHFFSALNIFHIQAQPISYYYIVSHFIFKYPIVSPSFRVKGHLLQGLIPP